jgi:glycerol uptake facilitator protein
VPYYLAAQVLGAVLGAATILGVLGKKASDVGLGVASAGHQLDAGVFASSSAPSSWCTVFGVITARRQPEFAGGNRARRVRGDPPGGAGHWSVDQPARTFGPMLVQQFAGGSVK